MDADVLTLAGIVAQRTGRTDDAIAAFRAARGADPGDAGRCQNLAVALKNAGDHAGALAAFSDALALRPDHPGTLANMGSCLIEYDRCEEAVVTLEQALAHAPDHADALNNMGVALARLGRLDEACEAYRRALAVRPDHPETCLNLADALARAGQPDDAQWLVEHVLVNRPGQVRAANQLGLLREAGGDFEGAVAALCSGYDPAAPHHALGVNLARVLIRSGRPEDALAVCDRLISTQPSVTTPLALALAALDRLDRDAQHVELMALDRFVSVHEIDEVAGFSSLDDFNAALVRELRAHPSLTFEPEGLVTRKGRQSDDLAQSREPALCALAAVASSKLETASKAFAAMPCDHPFLRAMPREWSLTMWGTILRPGGEVGAHIHAPNWMSGVYYPEFEAAPNDAAEGAFVIGVLPQELGGGGKTVLRQPRAGRMILFPSYLWHATMPFGGERERISFAFDLVPAGIGRPHRLR
jgi:Flp pilus assembly protein TadD